MHWHQPEGRYTVICIRFHQKEEDSYHFTRRQNSFAKIKFAHFECYLLKENPLKFVEFAQMITLESLTF